MYRYIRKIEIFYVLLELNKTSSVLITWYHRQGKEAMAYLNFKTLHREIQFSGELASQFSVASSVLAAATQ